MAKRPSRNIPYLKESGFLSSITLLKFTMFLFR